MANAMQNVDMNNSLRSDIANPEYEEMITEYQSAVYDDLLQVQTANTSDVVPAILSNSPHGKAVTNSHQKIQISLWLLCLIIIICSLIAIILTGVVTFLITKNTLPENQYSRTNDCDWLPWSTCDNGVKVRIRQKTYNARICGSNDTFEAQTCSGDDVLIDMQFSRTALFKNWFISADKTILSNVHTHDTSRSNDAQLQNYQGTISNTCVGNNEIIYYEVNYTYTMIKPLPANYLILEVGLAERAKVDKYHYVGSSKVSGRSFYLATKQNISSVYLSCQDANSVRDWGSFSDNTVGTKMHGKFELFINRRRNEFSLRLGGSVGLVFKNVTSSGKLCPVFGVYNSGYVNVKLQLMNPRNFTNYPW